MSDEVKKSEFMYLGKRSVYTSGNSKHISIPRPVLKELAEKNFKEVEEVEVFYNRETREVMLKFLKDN